MQKIAWVSIIVKRAWACTLMWICIVYVSIYDIESLRLTDRVGVSLLLQGYACKSCVYLSTGYAFVRINIIRLYARLNACLCTRAYVLMRVRGVLQVSVLTSFLEALPSIGTGGTNIVMYSTQVRLVLTAPPFITNSFEGWKVLTTLTL